ncbi:Protein transport protein SEC24 [Verticillium dahliae VDG1]|nr:Protein transport protein SEC24 [Verticillium dahliae VDG1]
MAQGLGTIFAELGILQYLDTFVEQGFDTWATILDITESDLDALGVKLGHRRKLQRRIANSRGLAPDASLVSPIRASVEDTRTENTKPEPIKPDSKDVAVVTKRKYRRHPKPDENAPERPPSAYVLFSNKMRDDLKGRNLTFTEIAKLVGENWQSLSPVEKEPFETQALNAKEKYNQDLAEYKKTYEYKKYAQYLHDFKQKQLHQNQAAKNGTKRLKLDANATRVHQGSSASVTPGGSGTGSGSDSVMASDGSTTRKDRVGSVTSMPDYPFAPTLSHQHTVEESMHSPASTAFEIERSPVGISGSPHGPHQRARRPTWSDRHASPENGVSQHLPSLSDVFNGDRMAGVTRTSDYHGLGGYAPGPVPPPHSGPMMPLLKHEMSSAGSAGSPGPAYSRMPGDASLPIHALLSSSKPSPPAAYEQRPMPFFGQPAKHDVFSATHVPGPDAMGVITDQRGPPPLVKYSSSGSSGATDASTTSSRTSISVHEGVIGPAKADPNLDGMSALLRAGEIVGRRES